MIPRLICLALGAFAIGTEGFMITGLLPSIAAEFRVGLAVAGQLVSIFGISYAIASPVLGALSGGMNRRHLLISALTAFSLANFLAAASQTFLQLAMARILLALTAALYMPSASAVAAVIAEPGKRGRAIAIITGGGTVALALGVPLGTWIAAFSNWRATFFLAGCLGGISTISLLVGLPHDLPGGSTTLSQRLMVARKPGMLPALAISFLWAAGGFTFYTYIAPFLTQTAGLNAKGIGAMLACIGICAAIGTALGGHATDRFGANPTAFTAVVLLVVILSSLSLAAQTLPSQAALPVIACIIGLWAIAGWGFGPAQQSRLVHFDEQSAPVTLSLHASAVYAGVAAGAALGALTIQTVGLLSIGWSAAACQAVGFLLLAKSTRLATNPAVAPSC